MISGSKIGQTAEANRIGPVPSPRLITQINEQLSIAEDGIRTAIMGVEALADQLLGAVSPEASGLVLPPMPEGDLPQILDRLTSLNRQISRLLNEQMQRLTVL